MYNLNVYYRLSYSEWRPKIGEKLFQQKHEESRLSDGLINIRTVLCKGPSLFLVFLRIPKLVDYLVGRKLIGSTHLYPATLLLLARRLWSLK